MQIFYLLPCWTLDPRVDTSSCLSQRSVTVCFSKFSDLQVNDLLAPFSLVEDMQPVCFGAIHNVNSASHHAMLLWAQVHTAIEVIQKHVTSWSLQNSFKVYHATFVAQCLTWLSHQTSASLSQSWTKQNSDPERAGEQKSSRFICTWTATHCWSCHKWPCCTKGAHNNSTLK